ncbi:PA0069 family radical SAM protein [Calidithermus timidus]|jgi:DNA repair photolyase|uniref:PA0069 family radical SAM protein n=1 Tax=Calidithermus timidus TaxID=307124 RepID=UPI0003668779|nr:PA0069 family radical SAM protein [Calidithermus timidus]
MGFPDHPHPSIVGRGAASNPSNRFERLQVTLDPHDDCFEPEAIKPQTQYFKDHSRSILARNDSPDVGAKVSINPYRGCEHGCVYCYARPTHEYLGFSLGLDFESKIMVKTDAPELLRKELAHPRWQPQVVMFSGVTDIYQPAERHFELTRRCLEVFLEFRNPVGMVTKNYLITRDLDLLVEMARYRCVSVGISLTTLDEELRRLMEPRTSAPRRRLAAIEALASAGVQVGVMTAPIIPGLNDHEIPALIREAAQAGARWAAYTVVHLPYGLKELFTDWLSRHYPERKEKVLGRIRAMRGGQLNDPRFGYRMTGEGVFADQIRQLFRAACRKAGLPKPAYRLTTEHFRVPGVHQPRLW